VIFVSPHLFVVVDELDAVLQESLGSLRYFLGEDFAVPVNNGLSSVLLSPPTWP
jgi:hypothetical protein